MNKAQFIYELETRLSGLPQNDLEERLSFYREMIDDRIEDGLSEEDAVAVIGSVDAIVEQIMEEIPLSKLVKEKVRQRRGMRAWEIVLLILGAPIWLPLLLSAFVIGLSLYLALWAIVIGFWAADLGLAAGAIGGLCIAVYYMIQGNLPGAISILGAALVCAGLTILLFFACLGLTKGMLRLSKKMLLGIKALFIGKERA